MFLLYYLLACTLSSLSAVISNESEQLLIDILDFLVELMQYKSENLMDAYSLGDALGKVVLGPADCGPIMTEKAGHFLTRMIIEHSKINRHKNDNKPEAPVIRRIDSGFDYAPSFSCHSYYTEFKPLCKQEGTFARAKFYNRVISKTKCAGSDWIENTTGIQPLLDDDYDLAPDPPEKPWISIFTASDMLQKSNKDMGGSPTLFRILREAVKPLPHIPSDPFATSYLFNNTKIYWAEKQIQEAFTEFEPQTHKNNLLEDSSDKNGPLKKLNHSLSHLKLNIKKYRSRHDLLDESLISEDTDATMIDDDQLSDSEDAPIQRPVKMKSMMKKIIKIGGISHQARERYNNKISV